MINRHFWYFLTLLFFCDFFVIVDVTFLRPIFGIILLLLPAILFMNLFGLREINSILKTILLVGISVSLNLIIGLIINFLLHYLGFKEPLSTYNILLFLNFLIIFSLFFIDKENFSIIIIPKLKFYLNKYDKFILSFSISIFSLVILGTYQINEFHSNSLLLFTLFLFILIVLSITFFSKKIGTQTYPAVILLLSISLIIILSLRSNHILGMDTHEEFYYFKQTLKGLYWQFNGESILESCLSISLLPTVILSITNLSSEFLFKIFSSLILSFSPLIVYVISKKYLDELFSFFASFFFMSQYIFLWTTSNARTNLAVFFISLTFMILLIEDIKIFTKKLLFFLFSFCSIISHYGSSYIFLFIIIFYLIESKFFVFYFKIRGNIIEKRSLNKFLDNKLNLSIGLLLILIAMIFFWYSQITEIAFNSGFLHVKNIYSHIADFFSYESRGGEIQTVTGKYVNEITQYIKFIIYWFTIIYIAFGVFYIFSNYKKLLSISDAVKIRLKMIERKIDFDFFVIAVACSTLLFMGFILPFYFQGYNISRAFFLTMPILSFFLVLGGISLAQIFKGNRKLKIFLLLALLISNYMATTNLIDEFFGKKDSIALDSDSENFDFLYVFDDESMSAKWLGQFSNLNETMVFTDFTGDRRLVSQGLINWKSIDRELNLLKNESVLNGYVYLRHYNIMKQKLFNKNYFGESFNLERKILYEKNKCYSNFGSIILI